MSPWEYRKIESMADLEQVVDLEIIVWGLNPRDAAPSNLMHAMAHAGSLVVGAYDNQQIIGMALAFPAKRDKQWILWSHMAAVHPDYQGQGIGFELKQFQRTWALEQGFNTMAWTFDPLQPGNAKFNLHYLGATTNTYHINFYGQMTDAINAGLPSDRVEANWDLRKSGVGRAVSSKKNVSKIAHETPYLLRASHSLPISDLSFDDSQPYYYVEIPFDFTTIRQQKPDLALKWQLALREVFCEAFEKGWTTTDFISTDESCYYQLTASPWFLYVVECNDGSLYTGISPDVCKRIATHNRGRGAAYTAARRPVKLVGAWRLKNRVSAMRAEIAFKRLSRQEKLRLIANQLPFEDSPFKWLEIS